MTIDGAALVHLLPTNTFDEYADSVFLPYLTKQLEKCSRLDMVWDTYIADSIKASIREKMRPRDQEKSGWKKLCTNQLEGFPP